MWPISKNGSFASMLLLLLALLLMAPQLMAQKKRKALVLVESQPGCRCPGCCPPVTLPCCDPRCPKCLGKGPTPRADGICSAGCGAGGCSSVCPCDFCACCYTIRVPTYTTTTCVSVDVRPTTITQTWTVVTYTSHVSTSISHVTLTVTDVFQYTALTFTTTIDSITSTTTSFTQVFSTTVVTIGQTTLTITSFISTVESTTFQTAFLTPTATVSILGSSILADTTETVTMTIAETTVAIDSPTVTFGGTISVSTVMKEATRSISVEEIISVLVEGEKTITDTPFSTQLVTQVLETVTLTYSIPTVKGTVTVTNSNLLTTTFTLD